MSSYKGRSYIHWILISLIPPVLFVGSSPFVFQVPSIITHMNNQLTNNFVRHQK